MITLKKYLEIIDYRITDSSDFQWKCYGYNAMSMDHWNGDNDGHSVNIVFDTKNQTVYEMQAHDYNNNRAYRWIDPEYRKAYKDEATSRNVDYSEAYDDVSYIDLETEEDILEKSKAIVDGVEYDTRVSIPIDMPDSQLFAVMKLAHEHDMTLNQYIEKLLSEYIEDYKNDYAD